MESFLWCGVVCGVVDGVMMILRFDWMVYVCVYVKMWKEGMMYSVYME